MPVREITANGRSYYQWGESGALYRFDPESESSRARARRKAEIQGWVVSQRTGENYEDKRSFTGTEASEPAPPKDKIEGSEENRRGSASTTRGGIEISAAAEKVLRQYLKAVPDDKREGVTVGTLKAVYRRGAGAYSTSHDPRASRSGWAFARVKAFIRLLKAGRPDNPKYTGDFDLLPSWHKKATKKRKDTP
jgi:hypothetical protein